MTSSSLIYSSRCAINEMNQSSEIIESPSMALDITRKKIQGTLFRSCHHGRYPGAETEIKSSNMKRLSWIKSQERRNKAKSRQKIESQDSTTSEESDLHKEHEYTAVLNDLNDTGVVDVKGTSEKRRKARNCRKDKKKKMNDTKTDYFDLTIDDCDSDVSELTVEGFDNFENFETAYDCSSNEGSESPKLPQDTSYCDAKGDAVQRQVHHRALEKLLSRQDVSRCGSGKQFLKDYSNADCSLDSLIDSSWRDHLKVLDDWRQFTKQLSGRRIGSVLEANYEKS